MKFETDLGYVYLCRDTCNRITVWDPNIGIRKEQGCVMYYSATQYGHKNHGLLFSCKGLLLTMYRTRTCREIFGAVPREGEAWLVNTSTGVWKRIDEQMHLVKSDTGEIIYD